jgi:hypothetical protein
MTASQRQGWIVLGVGLVGWLLLDSPVRDNPHPIRRRKKWSSYANTATGQRRFGRGVPTVRLGSREHRRYETMYLDPDSPLDHLLEWIAYSTGRMGAREAGEVGAELDELEALANGPEGDAGVRRATDRAWEMIGDLAELDEF